VICAVGVAGPHFHGIGPFIEAEIEASNWTS
jgi:hypothetical protein